MSLPIDSLKMIMSVEDAMVTLEIGEDEEDVLNEARSTCTYPSSYPLLLESD